MKIRYIDALRSKDADFTLDGRICKVSKAGAGIYLADYGLMAFISGMTLPHNWRYDQAQYRWIDLRSGVRIGVTDKVTCQVAAVDPIRGELLLIPEGVEMPSPALAEAAASGVNLSTVITTGSKNAHSDKRKPSRSDKHGRKRECRDERKSHRGRKK